MKKLNKLIGIIISLVLLVFVWNVNFIIACDQDVVYTYYDEEQNFIKTMNINCGEHIYWYSYPGGWLLREHHAGLRKLDRDYSYYANGSVQKIKTMNGEVTFEYWSPNANSKLKWKVSNFFGHEKRESWHYDSNGNVDISWAPGVRYKYEYYVGGENDGKLWTKTETRYNIIAGTKTTQTRYYYEDDGSTYTIKIEDPDLLLDLKEMYDIKEYPCDRLICDDPDCKTHHTETDTCEYGILKEQETGNIDKNYKDNDGDEVIDEIEIEQKTPQENFQKQIIPAKPKINEDYQIEEDNNFMYAYYESGDNEGALRTITSKMYEDENGNPDIVTLSYDPETGELSRADFSNEEYNEYFYDAFGDVHMVAVNTPNFQEVVLTGGVISNVLNGFITKLTGLAIGDNEEYYTEIFYDFTGNGDYYSEYDNEQILKLPEFSELVTVGEEYKALMQTIKSCEDFDAFNGFGDSLLNGSYVVFDGFTYFDECKDEKTVVENYCLYDLWSLRLKQQSREFKCRYGCDNGACLINPNETPENITQEDKDKSGKICYDDDLKNDLGVKGEVDFAGDENQEAGIYSDKCEENGLSVRQYFCVDNKLRNSVTRCKEGTSCNDGACV